jgi:acyl-CoA thioester hydrolase
MTENPEPEKFQLEIEIQADDIDILGHVNNVVYLRYVQDAAISHWNAAATEEDKRNFFWVVTRHEIDYKRPAFQNDVVVAQTWIGESMNGLFERHTELLRKADMKILAKARTLWCPIDPLTKRPTQVSKSVFEHFSTNYSK